MSQVTYGTVDRALRSLGFTCKVLREEPAARWYEHPEKGAVVSVLLLPEGDPVFPQHLAAVQATLKVHGIVDPLDFAAELQKAG